MLFLQSFKKRFMKHCIAVYWIKWTRRKKRKSMLLKRKKRRQKRVRMKKNISSITRHCFWVLKNKNIEEIPEKYIMRRWRRDIIPPELRSRRNRYGSDEKMLKVVLEKLKLLKKEVEAQVPKPSKKKDDIIGNMIGVSKPSTIEIQNPPVGNYKGCANDKRLMSGKEKAIKESKKRKFTCGKCGRDDHNHRTCDKKKKAKEQAETSEI
ncbi:uncharacterized protein [Rutidosis leptorrhynchoides]|uniref:uncharacterized protein n=1 Tax=Rutidosis leptorrhynchoides TaxID=125765 RepID=UPI003A9A47BA